MTIKVVRGNPTPEELAAVVALLSSVRTAAPAPEPRRTRTVWASPRLLLRAPQGYGPVGWPASALPQ
ncbi:acyl-CoA carboxylase subunit epsilon [Streptomyces sp. SID4956]|uniref:acyl-CoA carboxylase epsilon subunit n=1 Tax=Streptomyces sp. SID4956 TaxID=2690290 RepID=UPI00136C3824|nr:acyl-CoA carboxylase subunit epsilon [Streptomyces sp. SID4956]